MHPGKDKEDEVLYGSGQSSDPVHTGHSGLTGGNPQNTSTTGNPLASRNDGDSSSYNPNTTSTGYGTSNIVNPSSTTGSGAYGGNTGTGMTGFSNKTAGPHSSNLANKADPRVDSDMDGSRNVGGTSGGHRTYADDGASTTAIKHGIPGHDTSRRTDVGTSVGGGHAGDTNKPLPHTPASFTGSPGTGATGGALPDRTVGNNNYGSGPTTGAGYGDTSSGYSTSNMGGSTTSGPHSSNLANKADPRVDSERDGLPENTPGKQWGHTAAGKPTLNGREGSFIGGVWRFTHGPHPTDTGNRLDPAVAEDPSFGLDQGLSDEEYHRMFPDAPLHDRERQRLGLSGGTGPTSSTTGYDNSSTSSTGRTGYDHSLQSSSGRTGYDSTPSTSVGGTGSQSASRDHHHGHGTTGLASSTGPHSSSGQSSGLGDSSSGPAPHTAGPHKSDLLNKLDPRVDSDRDGSKTVGTAPGTSTSNTTGGPQPGRSPYSGSGVDPRVDSTPRTGTTGSGYGGGDHQYGRDAGLVAGGAGAGAGAYAAGHHHGGTDPTGRGYDSSTSGTQASGYGSGTAGGPHSSNLANKADPRVDSDRDGSHRYGRDTAVGTGAGVGGATAGHGLLHKHDKHQDPAGTGHGTTGTGYGSSTTAGPHSSGMANKADPRVDSDRDGSHHHGRDTAVGAGAGAGAATAGHGLFHKKEKHQDPAELDREREREGAEKHKSHGLFGGHDKEKDKHHDNHHDKHHDNHHDKDTKHEKKEKHGLLGFLHKDKDQDQDHSHVDDKKHHDSATTTGSHGHDTMHHGREHDNNRNTGTGVNTTNEAYHTDMHQLGDRNRLHKDPKEGYPSGADPTDPSIGPGGMVKEPITGLPMDVKHHGSGAGGTDHNPIPGYHGSGGTDSRPGNVGR